MSKEKYTNRLSKETSPYLLQHAHNPVDWYPWGQEALQLSKEENKPILVSIGYSTCHWCHVMERESFENEEVAAYMNEHFVNIKIDREERPDIDQIYMEAVQMMIGSGGWPLNCFLTPDLEPFYGGTYFPPEPNYGRASWLQILHGIVNAYHYKYEEIKEQSSRLKDHIEGSSSRFLNKLKVADASENVFTPVKASNMFHSLKDSFDIQFGGFGGAPKFPSTMALKYLLDYHIMMKDEKALEHVELSLTKMIEGGIYDQLGGGFSRYSTDGEWLAPHFEKMLYDNALLVDLLSNVYSQTQNPLYKEAIIETLGWVDREMTSPENGFYSALDADSEGVEGKFYVWSEEEIDEVLGEEAKNIKEYYDVSKEGNWEGHTILRRKTRFNSFSQEIKEKIQISKQKLFLQREKRIRPSLDDKILLDWNALMISAYCKAFMSLEKEEYKNKAVANLEFLFAHLKNKEGFFHTYKDGIAKYDAFLDDYAYLIEALLNLYGITFELCYLEEAKRLSEFVIKHFYDSDAKCFYFTTDQQKDILVRKKEFFDNATPSGNATMAMNLRQLSIIYREAEFEKIYKELLWVMSDATERYPLSFSKWANAMLYESLPLVEIAIVGEDCQKLAKDINKWHLPNKVMMASLEDEEGYSLLEGRKEKNRTLIYFCSNYICQQPVTTIKELKELL